MNDVAQSLPVLLGCGKRTILLDVPTGNCVSGNVSSETED